ncbi:glutaredoxin family protein [Candidatus Nitrospira bockiana]
MFIKAGCPHCEAATLFLADLARERPDVRIVVRDIGADRAARARLDALAERAGVVRLGVPTFWVNGELIIGFSGPDTTGARVRARLKTSTAGAEPSDEGVCRAAPDVSCDEAAPDPDAIDTALFGRLSVKNLGLPAFTVAIGLLDGFNPCAMWVLLFLLSLLVNLHDRRTMLIIAGTFVIVSGLVYFVFMAAWLNVFLVLGLSRSIQIALGLVAVLIGSVHVKDFFAFHRGLSFSIPDSAKPRLYARMRAILEAKHLGAAIVAVVVLAGLVNLVELLCTAGFPAIYTHILTLQDLPSWQYYAYLALYNLAYVLDDGIMAGIAIATLGRHKLKEREGRWLKLISGSVMLALGLLLILKPEWLQ